ncbi:hypothetical protein H9L39_09848 [Fusarium oxysporum f. sp. albedinis]|nr:hypothetical protein H9L39_09848 [Fusarium oxysporum f. sp. albedinis]
MVSFKKVLTLLFISTVSALPVADSNGQLSDLMLDKRNLLDSRAVCKASDPNNQAFKKNQANGSAAPTPTVYIPSTEVHCNVVGYGDDNNYWSGGSGQSIKDPSFSVCRDFCLSDSEATSFRFNSIVCDCYNGTVSAVVTPDASAPWTWYDMLLILTLLKPAKRALKAVQVPDYLPSKAPSDISSACSCLIPSPSAPTTVTITAKASRTITTTQTRTNTFSVNKLRSTFVTDRKTSTSTSSSKTTKTGSETVTQTNRKSATVTKPVTVTVTNFNTVIVTNTNVVEATNYNTLYFTNVDAVAETDYNIVAFTNTEGFTVTQYYTTVQTDVATSVITPDAVTVTSGTTTVWGS